MILLNAARMAPLPTNVNLTSLVANSSSPLYRSGSPSGGAGGAGTLLSRLTLSAGTVPSTGGWSFGSQLGGVVSCVNDGTNTYIRAQYPIDPNMPDGGVYLWGAYTPSVAQQDLYITIYARMPTTYKYGMKFCKLFSEDFYSSNGSVAANTTFGLDYTGVDFGGMYCTSFGDGTTATNDTQNIILFDGTSPSSAGRSYPSTAVISTPQNSLWSHNNWGTTWHKFQLRARMNTTNGVTEVADGAYQVIIDGVTYVNATGLFNRNKANGSIASVNFLDYTKNNNTAFELHLRDITISTGGWVD